MRRASRARFSRWSAADGATLLHERRGAQIRAQEIMFASARPSGNKTEIYHDLALQARGLFESERDSIANAANLSALLYHGLDQLNWAGFYFLRTGTLVLGPFQGKPACVRIALGKGVCGTAASQRKSLVVPDVEKFPGHITCDRDALSHVM